MSNETKQTNVENANANANAAANVANVATTDANTQTEAYKPQTYKRTIIGAEFDAKNNAVWLRLDEPFKKGEEGTDSFGKSCRRLCESGAHPLFVLVCKKSIKPIMSTCLFLGAKVSFDVIFAISGETVDGYTLENDTWCITNVRISPYSILQ